MKFMLTIYCCIADVGEFIFLLFSFFRHSHNQAFDDKKGEMYSIAALFFAAIIIGLTNIVINQENYSWELKFTIASFTVLTAILLFCLSFRVFEVLDWKDKKSENKEYQRKLKRRKEELSFGGVLLSFLGVAFPLFVQANTSPCTTAGNALGVSALDLVVLLLMFSWYAEIVWDCNE